MDIEEIVLKSTSKTIRKWRYIIVDLLVFKLNFV